MKTAIMFPRPAAVPLTPSEVVTCSFLVSHLRECVSLGISERVLLEKQRIAELFINRLRLAPT